MGLGEEPHMPRLLPIRAQAPPTEEICGTKCFLTPYLGPLESQVTQPSLARSLQGCDMDTSTRLARSLCHPDPHPQVGTRLELPSSQLPGPLSSGPATCASSSGFQSQDLPPRQARERARDQLHRLSVCMSVPGGRGALGLQDVVR